MDPFPSDPAPVAPEAPPARLDAAARALAISHGLKIWRHRGVDGVNVYSQDLAEQLQAAGCTIRVYQPELLSKPERLAWECVLPNPYPPLEVEPDGMAEGT